MDDFYAKAGVYPNFLKPILTLRRSVSTISKSSTPYDTYKKDIAMVKVYFKKAKGIQMVTQSTMSWTDYFSTVGGLLGLVLGMGIVSFIELFWLCLRISHRLLEPFYRKMMNLANFLSL